MADAVVVTQDFLDSAQYQTESILHYEGIYGKDFVSPGGKETALQMIRRMGLAPGSRVLDVGCGLGGSAFVMAREFDLLVDGIDLSKNMLAIANAKLADYGLSQRVNLQSGDCLELQHSNYYDAVYSRDVFLHIHDKMRLFSVLLTALRPGGILLFTDYCCGERPWSDNFTTYVKNRAYCLHTLNEYAGLISQAGFDQVVFEDISERFIEILHRDLEAIARLELSKRERSELRQSWQQKLARSKAGDHRWGLFTAVKAQ